MLKQIHQKICELRKESISITSRQHLDKVLSWHDQAIQQNINWKKLEKSFLSETKTETKPRKTLFKDGAKFLRHWNGTTYTVIAQNNQFIYNNKMYKSLSKIAREITGTNWNGKLFFRVMEMK